jgi:DNA-binding protein HU-beta
MAVDDLTLEEMFDLERRHSPLVGSRTGVFLKPSERAGATARVRRPLAAVEFELPASVFSTHGSAVQKVESRACSGAKTLSNSQIAATVAEKIGITKKQAGQTLDLVAELAYKQAQNTFTVPGLGKLVLVHRPDGKMTVQFGPKKGQLINIPAKRVVIFRVAKATKDAILKK